MLHVRTFIDINSKICLTFGGFLNILLSWLVYKRTPKEMRPYSIIILQTCFCDLANLIIGDFVQPVLFIYNGIAVVISNGLAGQLAHPWNALAYYVWIFFAFFAIIGIIVQFFYRYLILCRNQRINSYHYFLMLGVVAVVLALYFGWLLSLSFPPADGFVDDKYVSDLLGHNTTLVRQLHREDVPPELRMALRGIGGQPFWIAWHVGFIATGVTVYACIAYFGRKMVLYTRKHRQQSVRSNAAELNRQLTLNLIFQATIPLAAMVGWLICAYACIFGAVFSSGWFNIFTSLVATPTQNWTSVLNPLVTIFTIKSYRRSLVRILAGGRLSSVGSTDGATCDRSTQNRKLFMTSTTMASIKVGDISGNTMVEPEMGEHRPRTTTVP